MPSRRPPDSQSSESDQDKLAAKLQVVGRRGVGRSKFVLFPTPRVTGHGSLDAALKELVRSRANQLEADAVGQRVANEWGEQFESNIGWCDGSRAGGI
jgi:hypothetical protein